MTIYHAGVEARNTRESVAEALYFSWIYSKRSLHELHRGASSLTCPESGQDKSMTPTERSPMPTESRQESRHAVPENRCKRAGRLPIRGPRSRINTRPVEDRSPVFGGVVPPAAAGFNVPLAPPPVSSDGRRAASRFFCQERSRKQADWLAFLNRRGALKSELSQAECRLCRGAVSRHCRTSRHRGDRNGFCGTIKGAEDSVHGRAKPAVPAHAVDGASKAILGDGEQNCEVESRPK